MASDLISRVCDEAQRTKGISRFNAIPMKISMAFFFHEPRTNYPKIHMESQKMPICQSNLEGKKAGNIILSELKLYHKAIVIKTAWYWPQNTDKSVEQNG